MKKAIIIFLIGITIAILSVLMLFDKINIIPEKYKLIEYITFVIGIAIAEEGIRKRKRSK